MNNHGTEPLVGKRSRLPADHSRFRFGLSDLLVAVTLYAVLFAFIGSWHPIAVALISVAFTALMIGRVTLFRGKRRLLASTLVGTFLGLLFGLLIFTVSVLPPGFVPPISDLVVELLLAVSFGCLSGVVLGGVLPVAFWLPTFVTGGFRQSGIAADSELADSRHQSVPTTRVSALRERWHKMRTHVVRHRTLVLCGLFVLLAVTSLHRPIRIGYHVVQMRRAWNRAWLDTTVVLPMHQLYCQLTGTPEGFVERYELSRDRLVELEYLVHRRFVFDNIFTATPEATQLWKDVRNTFPDSMHVIGSWAEDAQQPYVLKVWDRPDRIAQWESFVAERRGWGGRGQEGISPDF